LGTRSAGTVTTRLNASLLSRAGALPLLPGPAPAALAIVLPPRVVAIASVRRHKSIHWLCRGKQQQQQR